MTLLNQVTVDVPLTNMAVGWLGTNEGQYVCYQACPTVPVAERSGLYFEHDQASMLRDEAKPRAPGQAPAEGDFGFSTGQYACKEQAYRYALPDEVRANFKVPGTADGHATGHVSKKIAIRNERLFAENFFVSGVWDNDSTPTTTWEDPSSEPYAFLTDIIEAMEDETGFRANELLLGSRAAKALTAHPDFRGRLSDNNEKIVTLEFIAKVLGIKKVLVGRAVYNSAEEGDAPSIQRCFDRTSALLMYVTDTPSVDAPSACYRFAWSAFDTNGLTDGTIAVRQYRDADQGKKKDWYEGSCYLDHVVTASNLGHFIPNAVNVA